MTIEVQSICFKKIKKRKYYLVLLRKNVFQKSSNVKNFPMIHSVFDMKIVNAV